MHSDYDPQASGAPSAQEIERLPYRPCVGAMLINRESLVFVAQRNDTKSAAWQMPPGGIDEGEDPREAVRRELWEETGVESAEIIAESEGWLDYDLPAELIPKLWKGRYRGQRQKWFALRFLGNDGEIQIDRPGAEFSAWKWAPLDHLPNLIVPFKKTLYERLVEEFRDKI